MDAVGRATEDDADDGGVVLGELVVRQNLTKGIQLTYTTTYQLCRLGAEIQYDYFLLHKNYNDLMNVSA